MVKPHKVHHFTHTDLDGVGCACISQVALARREDVELEVKYCNYSDIDNEVNKLLDDLEEHRKIESYEAFRKHTILITDLSVNEETAKRLDAYNDKDTVVMLDHHKLPDSMRVRNWAVVADNGEESGTSLTFRYFYGNQIQGLQGIIDFVENVTLYDNWKFDPEVRSRPQDFNKYMYTFGRKYFVNYITDQLTLFPNTGVDLDDELLEALYDRDEAYIKAVSRKAKPVTYNGLHGMYVFAEQQVSRMGHRILIENPTIDFAVIILAPGNVSLRSRDDGDIDVAEIAKHFGGGGHTHAAGYQLAEPYTFTMEDNDEKACIDPEDSRA